jgi:hypothetical protein
MKKKPNFQQVIAGTLATAILAQSCTKYPDLYYDPSTVPNINQNNIYNSPTYPFSSISISLTLEEKEYLDFVSYLLDDILKNSQNAETFINDPNGYAIEAGYNNLELDINNDDLLKFIIALSDNEIRDAVKNNNITKFLQLCKQKNIIGNFNITNNSVIKKILEKNPNISHFFDDMPFANKAAFKDANTAVLIHVAVAIGAVVAAVVVVFVAAVVIAAAHEDEEYRNLGNDQIALQLWKFNGGDNNRTYALISEYTEMQITSIIETLRQNYPEQFSDINDDDLKQLIALNIQKFLE